MDIMDINNNSINSNINLRLTKLEEFSLSLSAHLEGERVLRKEEDEKCKELCDLIAKQVLEIKDSFSEERLALIQDQILNIVEAKLDEKMVESNNKIDAQYMARKEDENILNKKIDAEFEHFKFEINNINKRLEFIENAINKDIKDIYSRIDEIGNNQNNLRLFNNDINNKINDLNEAINRIEQDKTIDDNKLKLIENKIKTITLSHKENQEKNNSDLNNINNNLSYLKKDFNSLSQNYMKEIEDIKNNLVKQNTLKSKEIAHFEQHMLSEYENFTKFITDLLNQSLDKTKSMNEYLNSDVEIIKNKNQYLEEAILKLRSEFYDSMDKNYKYILDKMNSLFNLQFNNTSYDNDDNISDNEEKKIF